MMNESNRVARTYARHADGHTYYVRDGVLYGHPTNADGSCDFDPHVEIAAVDFAEPLTIDAVDEIAAALGLHCPGCHVVLGMDDECANVDKECIGKL